MIAFEWKNAGSQQTANVEAQKIGAKMFGSRGRLALGVKEGGDMLNHS
jgi:hypothetical protein